MPPTTAISVDEDGMLSVAFSDGVLANDTAADGQSLSATLVAGPANGTLTLGEDGSLIYVPNANFNGTDSFTYSATDGAGDSVDGHRDDHRQPGERQADGGERRRSRPAKTRR